MASKIPLVLDDDGNIERLQSGDELSVMDGNAYEKTGWDETVWDQVTIAFDEGTRTASITPVGADASYYIAGVKYTFSTEQSVILDNTEGEWYIYFLGATLTASQTGWIFDETKCFVISMYWDATNSNTVGFAPELHSWEMPDRIHGYLHETCGARYGSGLGVAEATSSTVNVAEGVFYDEDIRVTVTDEAGSGWWDQILSPLTAPIFYRSGAGDWRKLTASTSLCYLSSNIPQVNIYSGTWQWSSVSVNRYFAYWVLASTCKDCPVYIVPGQVDADSLSDAISDNTLSDMAFDGLPTEEHKVIAKIILKRIVASPYYEITQIDDYRSSGSETDGSGTTVSDHGGLTGLSDDDHTSYHTDARAATWIAANHVVDYAHPVTQVTHAGHFLTTDGSDGTDPTWTAIRQVTAGGTVGQVLTTDGSSYAWGDVTEGPQTDTLDTVCDRGNTTDQSLTLNGLQVNGYNDDSTNGLVWVKTDVDNNYLTLGSTVEVGRIQGRRVIRTSAGAGLHLDLIGQGAGSSVRVNYDIGVASDPFRISAGGTSYIDISPGLIVSSTGTISFNDENLQTTGDFKILADGSKQYFGAASDYSVEWNATNAVHTISAGAFHFDGGAIRLPTFTTVQRDALTPTNGMIIYNSDNAITERYEDGSWTATIPGGGVGETQVLTWVNDEWAWLDSAEIKVSAVSIYVKTTGSDTTGDGSSGAPYATVAKAFAEAKTWILLEMVTIYIERGNYPDTTNFFLDHAQGDKVKIDGDYQTDSATLSSSSGSSGAWSLVFTVADETIYTIGDYILIHASTGGTTPDYVLGTHKVTDNTIAGQITILSKAAVVTMASGAVVASVSIPQVRLNCRIYQYTSVSSIYGIQIHRAATGGFDYLWYVQPKVPLMLTCYHCLFINTAAVRNGANRSGKSAFVWLLYCGAANMSYGWFVDQSLQLNNGGFTDCVYGVRAYGGASFTHVFSHWNSNLIGLSAELMSLASLGGGTAVMVGNTTDSSPAANTEGNWNSYMKL